MHDRNKREGKERNKCGRAILIPSSLSDKKKTKPNMDGKRDE